MIDNNICWNPLNEECLPPISGHDYLVADMPSLTDENCAISVSKWYNEGDAIELKSICEYLDDEAEDVRLLKAVMYSSVNVNAPHDGFFNVTSDTGLMDNTYKMPVETLEGIYCVADYKTKGVWWAELPKGPNGLKNQNDKADCLKKEIEQKAQTFEEKKRAAIESYKREIFDFNAISKHCINSVSDNPDICKISQDDKDCALVTAILAQRVVEIIGLEIDPIKLDEADANNKKALNEVVYELESLVGKIDTYNLFSMMKNGLIIKNILVRLGLKMVEERQLDESEARQTIIRLYGRYPEDIMVAWTNALLKLQMYVYSINDLNSPSIRNAYYEELFLLILTLMDV